MSHLERIKYGLSSLFVSDLLIFCVGYSIEQNCSGIMMVLKPFLLGLCHLASGDNLPFSILRIFIAFKNNIPEICIKAKKKTFYSILPIIKFLTIKDGRFCIVSIVFVFRRTSHMSFSHAPDLLNTVRCGYQNRSSDTN